MSAQDAPRGASAPLALMASSPGSALRLTGRCRACHDYIVGPSIVCAVCGSRCHGHCAEMVTGAVRGLVCHACFAERDILLAQQQAAQRSFAVGSMGRYVAQGAQHAGSFLGSAAGVVATGASRLATGIATSARGTWNAGADIPTLYVEHVEDAPSAQRPQILAADLDAQEVINLRARAWRSWRLRMPAWRRRQSGAQRR